MYFVAMAPSAISLFVFDYNILVNSHSTYTKHAIVYFNLLRYY